MIYLRIFKISYGEIITGFFLVCCLSSSSCGARSDGGEAESSIVTRASHRIYQDLPPLRGARVHTTEGSTDLLNMVFFLGLYGIFMIDTEFLR